MVVMWVEGKAAAAGPPRSAETGASDALAYRESLCPKKNEFRRLRGESDSEHPCAEELPQVNWFNQPEE